MDRPTVYTQEQGRSVDFLFAARSTMIGLGKLAQAAFGSNTVVRGLTVTPNSPAALNVLVGIGEIYSLADVDATAWGSLPADTTDVIVKQGLNMASQTIATPAPATSGYSVAYLIECQYQDQDTNPAVLPYYNSSNPQIPLNGQGGNGAPQATQRQGFCVIQAKAGIAAPTGTQVAPSVDSGWTALAVVTVANGATTVTSGNISVPAGVPQISSLLQMMQTGSPGYAVDTSTTANQISLALTPAITAYTDGQEITFKAANSNTGPCTINAGGGSVNLVGVAGALQGGEIVAGKQYTALYSASLSELVLNSQTGGAEQVAPATASQHAMQFGQAQADFAALNGNSSNQFNVADATGAQNALPLSQAVGRLLNIQTFSSSGTYTPHAGTTLVIIEVLGGGGSGAGCAATGASQVSVGSGGGNGAYARVLMSSGFAGAAVTVGAPGAAVAGNASNAGGTSSFGGTLIVAPGGVGGGSAGPTTPPWFSGNGTTALPSVSGAAASGAIILAAGSAGGVSQALSTAAAFGAPGASSPFGGGGGSVPSNTPGLQAPSPGAGGGGCALLPSQAAIAGGKGGNGVVIIYEYGTI